MINCFFNNLQEIVVQRLNNATHSVKVAVAWINFEYYAPIFLNLVNKGIKVKIIVNDDKNNSRYLHIIGNLKEHGIKIKLLRTAGIMHHKFCLIDDKICMFGSFNWTDNANIRNIEDLNISDSNLIVGNYDMEFKALWELSKKDLKLIRKPDLCPDCKTPIFYIMFMKQEGDDQTKIDVLKMCSCAQKNVFTDYFDISVYMNWIGIYEMFENELNTAKMCNDEVTYNQLLSKQEYLLSNYLASVRQNRMGLPLIHAVGVIDTRWFNKHDCEDYYKIIWKERGTENYINDEYEIDIY